MGGPKPYPGRRLLTATLATASAVLFAGPALTFLRAGTSIDPIHPHRASTLLTTGFYQHSRNPIYVADVLAVAAHAAWLGRPIGWLGVPALVAALSPQIRAEEAVLRQKFGQAYDDYLARVRRWL